MDKTSEKERINEMIEAIMKVAKGDYSVQIKLSDKNDDHDSLAMGLNMMIDDIRTRTIERKQVQEALKNAEKEKAAILNSISELVVYHDMEMRMQWANREAGESVGLAPEELVGGHCYEIWHQRHEPCVGCPVVKASEIGQPQEVEMTTPDGRVWFVRGYPTRDANGDITGVVEVVLEITERKRMELEMEKRQISWIK